VSEGHPSPMAANGFIPFLGEQSSIGLWTLPKT
jgi:hypothetical protein